MMFARADDFSAGLVEHHTPDQCQTRSYMNDLRVIASQPRSHLANTQTVLTLHSNRTVSPTLGALRKDKLSALVEPSEAQKPGFATVSKAHPVQVSCTAACAPPAYCWFTFRYSLCMGNRQVISPLPCSPALAATS
jgi:hypothetical protein